MSARRAAPLFLAGLALAGCGGSDLPDPAPTSVTPARGYAAAATPIVIHGADFLVRTVQPASGGAPTVDETFQAWLGDQALQDVRRIDEQTLSATVPAGLAPGVKSLRVQGPFGTSGDLASAFTVDGSAAAAISAAIAATPATVSVGQSITVRLTVTTTGTYAANNVVPAAPTVTGTGTVGAPTGPAPASVAMLAPGDSATFTWTFPSTGAGTLAFGGAASATDSLSGKVVTGVTDPASPARVTVQGPAALTASLPASGSAAMGQEFTVAMTVTNGGGAAAKDVVPVAPTVTPAGRAALKPGTGAVPASVASLAGGAGTTFTWTFVAGSTPGTVTFSSSASGTDANSGAPVASGPVTSGPFTIGSAGMNATLSVAPATASVGQAITLTLAVTNPGLARVLNFVVGTPSVSSADGARATQASGPTPVPPAVLNAGQTVNVTWTFTPALNAGVSTGHVSFLVLLSGTDEFSGAVVTAGALASAAVQAQALLSVPAFTAAPTTVSTGQPVAVSMTVLDAAGGAGATSVAVVLTPTGPAGTTCVVVGTPPNAIPAGTTGAFSWSCTPIAAGTLGFTATVNGRDANSNVVLLTVNATATNTVTVVPQALLSVPAFTAAPTTVSTGQPVAVSMTVLDAAGGAGATSVAVVLTPTGPAGTTCVVVGTPPNAIPAGTTGAFSWSCTPIAAGTLGFTATVNGRDASSNAVLPTVTTPTITVTVQTQAALSVPAFTAAPKRVSTGEVVAVSMTVLDAPGGAGATSVAVVLTPTGPAGTTCVVVGTPPNAIPAGTTGAFSWSCTPIAAGTLGFTATVNGRDANSNVVLLTVNATATNTVTVQ